jgi:hypothetical protein
MVNPNHEDCQSCEFWDDVNGCWSNKTDVLDCENFADLNDQDDTADWLFDDGGLDYNE